MQLSIDFSSNYIKVGVIKLPHISNMKDFEPLVVDAEVELFFFTNASEMSLCDMVVLPGSKRVIDDLAWLKRRGFSKKLQNKKTKIVAISGGYEMMFKKILDPFGIESQEKEVLGFGRLKGEVHFQKEKIVQKGEYNLFGVMVKGYEIHKGITKKRAKSKKNFYGTFVHGLFDNDALRLKLFQEINSEYQGYNFAEYKQKAITDLI